MPLRLGHPNTTRRQRMEASLVASLLTYGLLVFAFALWGGLAPVHGQTSLTLADRALESATLAVIYGGMLCLVGWIVALPLVLALRHPVGIGMWIVLWIGSLLGPAILLILQVLYAVFTHQPPSLFFGTADSAFRYLLYLAFAVSTLTTLFYLLILGRHASKQPNDR